MLANLMSRFSMQDNMHVMVDKSYYKTQAVTNLYGDHNVTGETPVNVEVTRNLTAAAVLVPIISQDGRQFVILTKRASHLDKHPGQVSLPGGRADIYDEDLIETALRETEEEIGVERHSLEVFGAMEPYVTVTDYAVTPILAVLEGKYQFNIDHLSLQNHLTMGSFSSEKCLETTMHLLIRSAAAVSTTRSSQTTKAY